MSNQIKLRERASYSYFARTWRQQTNPLRKNFPSGWKCYKTLGSKERQKCHPLLCSYKTSFIRQVPSSVFFQNHKTGGGGRGGIFVCLIHFGTTRVNKKLSLIPLGEKLRPSTFPCHFLHARRLLEWKFRDNLKPQSIQMEMSGWFSCSVHVKDLELRVIIKFIISRFWGYCPLHRY